MTFDIEKSLKILRRTPEVLENLLSGLSEEWLNSNEGENTWSAYQVLGHLIHGEKTDWMVRAKIILSESENKTFAPFDRFAQDLNDQTVPVQDLLHDFKELRHKNLQELKSLEIQEKDLEKKGMHPELGEVTLQELLATWTVHDLGHIAQISRVMAKQYSTEVGPWTAYLGILKN